MFSNQKHAIGGDAKIFSKSSCDRGGWGFGRRATVWWGLVKNQNWTSSTLFSLISVSYQYFGSATFYRFRIVLSLNVTTYIYPTNLFEIICINTFCKIRNGSPKTNCKSFLDEKSDKTILTVFRLRLYSILIILVTKKKFNLFLREITSGVKN